MPSFAYVSRLKDSANGFSLSFKVQHILFSGKQTHSIQYMRLRLPDNVNVVLPSTLVFSLDCILNKVTIPSNDVQKSAIARYMVDYLRAVTHVQLSQLLSRLV